MTDKELLYIITIAEERNITHAGEKLHLAQPSLTQTLRKIESELGSALFVRRKYGLDPTPVGELYISMARDILARMELFQKELEKQNSASKESLMIGASWYNTLLFLSDTVQDLNALFPEAEISLVEKSTNTLFEMLIEHSLYLILTHEYPSEFPHTKRSFAKDILQERLLVEPFCLVAHEKFGIDMDSCNLRMLGGLPFISFNDNQRICRITDFAVKNAGTNMKKVVRTQSFPGAIGLAERGVGLVILPEYYVKSVLPKKTCLRYYPINPEYHAYWSTYVYYRDDEQHGLIDSVLPILRKTAEKYK